VADPSAHHLLDAGTRRVHRDGAHVFREGDEPHAAYVVVRGTVRIELCTPTGDRLVLALKGPGELVGELGALDGRPRSASAAAVGEVELRQIPVAEFLDALERDGPLAVRLLLALSSELRASVDRTTSRRSADVVTRLARCLCDLGARLGEHDPRSAALELHLTQDELAAWIGATREATARSLRRLREDGCVTTGRGRVTVVDLPRLRTWAG
jgi:CRP-like cAMP-binding protein